MDFKRIVAVVEHPLLYDTTSYLFIVVIWEMVDDDSRDSFVRIIRFAFGVNTQHSRGVLTGERDMGAEGNRLSVLLIEGSPYSLIAQSAKGM